MTHFAYVHARPETVDKTGIFYVGKGARRRFLPSIRRTKHHTNIVNKYGAKNILVGKFECSSEASALELEIGLIKCLRRAGVQLVNLTNGGEGTSGLFPTEETRAKLSEGLLTRWSDPEYRAKMREINGAVQKALPLSEKKRQAAMRNIQKAKIAQRDPAIMELSRRKNSEKSKAQWADPEYRAKLKATHAALWDDSRRATMSRRTAGRKRVNNGTEERNVFPDEMVVLLAQGWVKGRKPKVKLK